MYNKNVVSLVALGVLVLGTTMIVRLSLKADSYGTINNLDDLPTEVALSGEYVCLSKTESTFFSSSKCVPGLKTTGDVYYTLDFHLLDSAVQKKLAEGNKLQVEGLFISADKLGTPKDANEKRDIRGILTVQRKPVLL